MKFSAALEAMDNGHRVARAGWNGKGMWICKGEGNKIPPENFWNQHTREFAERKWDSNLGKGGSYDEGLTEVLPYFIMKTADDKILMGWLASQSDMCATDWQVVS